MWKSTILDFADTQTLINQYVQLLFENKPLNCKCTNLIALKKGQSFS